MNGKKMAFPMGDDSMYKAEFGLTKLELISAMCLQGMLSNEILVGSWTLERSSEVAIENAKELLKQLEAEND